MGLDYSYAANTPGTNNRLMHDGHIVGGNDAILPPLAGAVPIPAGHVIHDRGTRIAGGQEIDCGAIITRLSAFYRSIDNNGWTAADRRGREAMSKPVIGVAVVDYPAINGVGGGLYAYLSRSGTGGGAHVGDGDAVRLAAAHVGQTVPELGEVNQWTLFSAVVASHLPPAAGGGVSISTHLSDRLRPLGNGAMGGWRPVGEQPGFYFLKSPTQIAKKWPDGHGEWNIERSSFGNFQGGCAMQKLMGNLYGYNVPLPNFPNGGGPRPYLSPNAQTAVDAPRLVCAAESAHSQNVPVTNWAAQEVAYLPGDEVPSCVACEGFIPEVITQNVGSCAVAAPAHGNLGGPTACGARLHHTGTCQFACDVGYELTSPPALVPPVPANPVAAVPPVIPAHPVAAAPPVVPVVVPVPGAHVEPTQCSLGLLRSQTCQPRPCQIDPPINGHLGHGAQACPAAPVLLASGGQCQVGCNPGYQLQLPGSDQVTCLAGQRSPQPICIPIIPAAPIKKLHKPVSTQSIPIKQPAAGGGGGGGGGGGAKRASNRAKAPAKLKFRSFLVDQFKQTSSRLQPALQPEA